MDDKIKLAVETYQCPGCVAGCDITCYEQAKMFHHEISCKNHVAGTVIYPIVGRIFLGMPKGFNRLGKCDTMKINILTSFVDEFDSVNIAVWKYLYNGNTIVRGLRPRINEPFIYIFLENCMDKINCLKITDEFLESID
jgi:hypothetical protein